ncbi:envelope glycoprotein UL132 [Aotine betaherpesvirus 1]|uniref:Envelope glycoprotein UL132 n=1 Tax=Aotine betaherpesvirus 1 TaxID=50290 RepID=G8XUI5_9BETA|nr:envelope glycoprotein UL132 [Aotine betaherpesvirus 1]AEV80826.1 envelope glycoprotein UL132 [Aotine betaherpesvirus 1]
MMTSTVATNITQAVNGTYCAVSVSLLEKLLTYAPYLIYFITGFSLLTLIIVTVSALYSSCKTRKDEYDPDIHEDELEDEEYSNLIKVPSRKSRFGKTTAVAKYQRLTEDYGGEEDGHKISEAAAIIIYNENYKPSFSTGPSPCPSSTGPSPGHSTGPSPGPSTGPSRDPSPSPSPRPSSSLSSEKPGHCTVATIEPVLDTANGAIRYYTSNSEDFKQAHEAMSPFQPEVNDASSAYPCRILVTHEIDLNEPEYD